MKSIITLSVICLLALTILTPGCYYDKEELLYPNSACDTSVVTYSTSVLPIISASCYNCHAGNTPSGGIRLDNHAALLTQVNNGKLLGAITHSPGYSPMPKNASKMNSCRIATIRKWIDDGAPNN